MEPNLTPRVWQKLSDLNCPSEWLIHIKAAIPSCNLSLSCAPIRSIVAPGVSFNAKLFIILLSISCFPRIVGFYKNTSTFQKTSRNLGVSIADDLGWEFTVLLPQHTFLIYIFSRILLRISASKLSSMACGVWALARLTHRHLVISSFLGPMKTLITLPVRRLSVLVRIWGLLVTNVSVLGDYSRVWFCKSGSLTR